MLRFRRRREPHEPAGSRLIALCDLGYCAVVGESYRQDALRATATICGRSRDGRPTFQATLIREPDNPHDSNAVAVHSERGQVGYLSRENAVAYGAVFEQLRRQGYAGGTCVAYLTGGEPGKPSYGVVLRLASPRDCLAHLRGEPMSGSGPEEDDEFDPSSATMTFEIRIGGGRGVVPILTPRLTRRGRASRSSVSADACWHPAGAEAVVSGRRLMGLVYVGSGLAPANETYWVETEPALIDPALPVGDGNRSADPEGLWPLTYERLSPDQRATYLDWLAGGRTTARGGARGSYADLFVAGLERRALVDAAVAELPEAELEAITTEVTRLMELYGENRGYRWSSFLEILRVRTLEQAPDEIEPLTERRGWQDPIELRVALGAFAKAGQRLPASWALSWARCSSQSWGRTPMHRCPEEFGVVFLLRYGEQFGEGLKLRALKTPITLEHYPLNQGIIRPVRYESELPDVASAGHVVNPLRRLVNECTDEIDAYSRYLGRHPESREDLAALSLLPRELIERSSSPALEKLRKRIATVGAQQRVLVVADDLIAPFAGSGGKVGKKEAVAFARLLASLGVGVEPDVRFAGATPRKGGTVVLFRQLPGGVEAPGPEYSGAATLLTLAAAVAAADGVVTEDEERMIAAQLAALPSLDDAERTRLAAHLDWLLAEPPPLRQIKARVSELREDERDAVLAFLLAIAGADGEISPPEVEVLRKIFVALGLDEGLLYQQLHALSTAPTSGPVTVREARKGDPEYPLPPGPYQAAVTLNTEVIEAKLAEAAKVSTLLAGIFVDDEPHAADASATASTQGLAGLDSAHSELLRRLGERTTWGAEEIRALCVDLGLLPDGALEVVNEAAFNVVGSPVWEGDDPLEVDSDVYRELRSIE